MFLSHRMMTGDVSDTTPAGFTFTDLTSVAKSTTQTSNAIVVTLINQPATITVSGGTYRINSGGYTSSAGTVQAGDTVNARHTSSASASTAVNTIVTIGGVSDTFTSTTTGTVAMTLTANTYSDGNLAGITQTFSSIAFGTAAANRQIVVAIQGTDTGSNQTISSMTIGGISATKVVAQRSADSLFEERVEIWVAAVPTGTSGTIVATWSALIHRNYIGVYSMTGATTGAYDTGVSTAQPLTDTLNIPADGGAIALATVQGGPSATWSGLTERYEVIPPESNEPQCGAMDVFATEQVALAVTCTFSSYPANETFCCASWGPA